MRLASNVISLCLHCAVFLVIWYWPTHPPLRIDQLPMTISLVDGATGGNRTPSQILGQIGEVSDGPLAPTPPAPQSDVAAQAREEIKTPEAKAIPRAVQEQEPETPARPEPIKVAESQPEPPSPVEPKPVEIPKETPPKKEETKAREVKKPDKPKPEKPKPPEPKKPEQPKKPAQKPQPKAAPKKTQTKEDPIAAALQQARKATSRDSSGDRGNAVEAALAEARQKAGGNRGGGGGEGDGAGGGGSGDRYTGQIVLAVRPNWNFPPVGRKRFVCVVKVNVDMQGKVLLAEVSQSSGNPVYDGSVLKAIMSTSQAGDFPPPPGPQYTDLEIAFTINDLRPQ